MEIVSVVSVNYHKNIIIIKVKTKYKVFFKLFNIVRTEKYYNIDGTWKYRLHGNKLKEKYQQKLDEFKSSFLGKLRV